MLKTTSCDSPESIKARLGKCTPHLNIHANVRGKELKSDNPPVESDTHLMNDITREEFNAKLETIEAKMDARAEAVSSKIDAFLAVQAERDQRFKERLNSSIVLSDEWNQKFRMLAEQSVQAAASAEASAKEAATLKTHFWASVIAQLLAVGAIVVGAYFANQANVLSAVSTTVSVFQAGKDQGNTRDSQPPSVQQESN
ncbi:MULTISPECIES: hypothetical protein [Pseudomonas]|nr:MULTISPECIES: hypothetical protein [Pseudomonas]MCE0965648.1 hypothetical protein [Pseudomonas sp. NMI4491_12]